MKTVECPTCHGAKFVRIALAHDEHADVMCVVCNGTGTVIQALANDIVAHLMDWCQCDEAEREHVKYYGEGEHPKLHKHHYRHEPGCGKIVQIG